VDAGSFPDSAFDELFLFPPGLLQIDENDVLTDILTSDRPPSSWPDILTGARVPPV